MKSQYGNYIDFMQEIDRIESKKADYIIPTQLLLMEDDDYLFSPDTEKLKINNYCHGQIATNLNIPKKYYDDMSQIKGLRSHNVNAWFREKPQTRLVRTLDGNARAWLSDRYHPMDNKLLTEAFNPVAEEYGNNIKVRSCSITDIRMSIQISFPMITADVKVGDPVEWGIMLTNSEVGAASVDVQEFIWWLRCKNGARWQSLFRKYHAGKRIDTEDMESYMNLIKRF